MTPEQEATLLRTVGDIDVNLKWIKDKVEGHDRTLNGNGGNGLRLKVDRHQSWLKLIGVVVFLVAAATATAIAKSYF